MPRPLRIHVPAAFYHVTLRGNHRQNIFFRPADRTLFEEITAEVIDRFNARLHAYCWMTNHVHLLLQVADTPLGRIMLRIAGRYARTVQKTLRTTGHLFEKRYHPVLVDAGHYLVELLRYIHLNPVRARMVPHPDAYPWSSHHAYVGAATVPWVTTDFALRLFHIERGPAIDAYHRFIACGMIETPTSPFFHCNPKDRRILGSDAFAERLLGCAWKPKPQKTLADLIDQACTRFSVTTDSLRSRSCQRHLTLARAWIAHQALILEVSSLSSVARTFNRSEASLRESVKHHFNYP